MAPFAQDPQLRVLLQAPKANQMDTDRHFPTPQIHTTYVGNTHIEERLNHHETPSVHSNSRVSTVLENTQLN